MKKILILLLIIPILGFTQNDLVFNRVLNFKLNPNETVTVPTAKAWKIENSSSSQVFISNENPAYGSAVLTTSAFAYTGGGKNAVWLAAGSILYAENAGPQSISFSILEFNVVAISSSSGGSDSGVSADGLKFSQVINYSGTYNFPTNYTGHIYETFEIPEGKVWKITSVTVAKMQGVSSTYDTAVRPSSAVGIQLGGIVIHLVSGGGAAYPEVHPINDTWINSGSKELFVTSYGANTKVSFTAIEYTIPE